MSNCLYVGIIPGLCKLNTNNILSRVLKKKDPNFDHIHRAEGPFPRVIASKMKLALSMFTTSILSFMASFYTSVKQRHSEWSCHQINVSLYSFYSLQQFLPFHAGGSTHARGPSVCVLSGIWVFLEDGGYCVTAAKVMKRANSKVQSGDSCSCMYTEHE